VGPAGPPEEPLEDLLDLRLLLPPPLRRVILVGKNAALVPFFCVFISLHAWLFELLVAVVFGCRGLELQCCIYQLDRIIMMR